MGFQGYFEQPLGGADPAMVGGCVLPVLSFNTNEEELGRAFGEEHSVETAVHIYKTSALEELEKEKTSCLSSPSSWIGAV